MVNTRSVVQWVKSHWQHSRAVYIVFGIAYLVYLLLAYRVGVYSSVLTGNFDCIFSTDTSKRYNTMINTYQQDAYDTVGHPFFSLVTRTAFLFLSLFTPNPKIATVLLQVFCAALAVTFFYLALVQLRMKKEIVVGMTILYGFSFVHLLYAIYYDSMILGAPAVSAFLYIMARSESAITKPAVSAGIFVLSVGGFMLGAIQYFVFLTMQALGIFSWRGIPKIITVAAISVAAFLLINLFVSATGILTHTYISSFAGNHHYHYNFAAAYSNYVGRPFAITGLGSYILFIISNLFNGAVYYENLVGVFINPIVSLPVLIGGGLFWSHGCTSFLYSLANLQGWLGLCLFGVFLVGAVVCIQASRAFYTALLLSFLGYVVFFGFGYGALTSYLYASQFAGFYLAIIAIGLSYLFTWAEAKPSLKIPGIATTTSLHDVLIKLCFVLLLAIVASNLYQFSVLAQFTLERFK